MNKKNEKDCYMEMNDHYWQPEQQMYPNYYQHMYQVPYMPPNQQMYNQPILPTTTQHEYINQPPLPMINQNPYVVMNPSNMQANQHMNQPYMDPKQYMHQQPYMQINQHTSHVPYKVHYNQYGVPYAFNPYTGSDVKYKNYHPAYSNFGEQETHIHEFTSVTAAKDGHKHNYTGTTEPAPHGVQHTHTYWAVTKYNDEHRHELKGESGPAIPLPGGGHTHEFKGMTYGYPSHQHAYQDQIQKSME